MSLHTWEIVATALISPLIADILKCVVMALIEEFDL